jgi:hypothetical protein
MLNCGPSASNNFSFFNLQHSIQEYSAVVHNLQFPSVLLGELFVFFIHVQQQLLRHVASNLVLVIKTGADAQVKRLSGLFLPGTFFEPTSFTS